MNTLPDDFPQLLNAADQVRRFSFEWLIAQTACHVGVTEAKLLEQHLKPVLKLAGLNCEDINARDLLRVLADTTARHSWEYTEILRDVLTLTGLIKIPRNSSGSGRPLLKDEVAMFTLKEICEEVDVPEIDIRRDIADGKIPIRQTNLDQPFDIVDRASILRYYLMSDIRDIFADHDRWLDTPNHHLGGDTPRQLIGTDREFLVRNAIESIKYGQYS